jgi:hypothetical protein
VTRAAPSAAAFRFARNEIEFLHEDSFAATFTTWTRTWRLPMSSTVNSAFELTGTVREVGRVGMEWSNAFNATRTVAGGGGVTFRNRFPAAPSSITLSVNSASSGFSGTPSTGYADRDGFGFFSYQSLAGAATRTGSARTPRSREEHLMAIQEITEHRARSALRQVRSREPRCARGIEVGIERDDQVEDSVVPLPECPTCRSREFLLRSPVERAGAPVAGQLRAPSSADRRRAALRAGEEGARRRAKLKRQGGKVFTQADRQVEAKQRFFDKGLKLPARAVEQLQGKEPGQ